MIKFEDNIEDAKRYIQGQMGADEIMVFEKLLRDHPAIKAEVELMQAMVNIMLELPDKEVTSRLVDKDDLPKRSVSTFFRDHKWLVWVGSVLISIAVLLIIRFSNPVSEVQFQSNPSLEDGLVTFNGLEKSGLRANTSSGLALGPNGNIFISGDFYRQIRIGDFLLNGDSGSLDLFIAKLSPQLQVQWARSFGGIGQDYAKSIIVDHSGAIIFSGILGDTIQFDSIMMAPKSDRLAGQARDIFLAKMNAEQEIIWVKSDGGKLRPYVSSGGGAINDLAVDLDNQIYAVGRFSNPSIWGHSLRTTKGANSFVAKFSPDGDIRWLRPLIGEYGVAIKAIDIEGSNIAVAGSFGHAAYNGDLLLDDVLLTSFGGTDLFLAKYDLEGQLIWARQAGSELNSRNSIGESANTVALDAESNSIIAGYFAGKARFDSLQVSADNDRDIFISKVDPDGNFRWTKKAGGGVGPDDGTVRTAFDEATSVALDSTGNIFVCGFFSDSSAFDSVSLQPKGMHDLFVAKYDPQGNLMWVKQMGGDNPLYKSDFAQKLVVTPEGICYVTGYFSGTLAIDDYRLESSGMLNIFILALDPKGNIRNFNQVLFAQI